MRYLNEVSDSGYTIGTSALEIPQLDEHPTKLRRLQLLVRLGYEPRVEELLVQAAIKDLPEIIGELGDISGEHFTVNVRFYGTTPLIAAVKHGSVIPVGMLLARDADPFEPDDEGLTAIDHSKRDLPVQNKPRDLEDIRRDQLRIRQMVRQAAGLE